MSGLPIRRNCWLLATKIRDKYFPKGRMYQNSVRKSLELIKFANRRTVRVMGGGEECGHLFNIINDPILVACGRNNVIQ